MRVDIFIYFFYYLCICVGGDRRDHEVKPFIFTELLNQGKVLDI